MSLKQNDEYAEALLQEWEESIFGGYWHAAQQVELVLIGNNFKSLGQKLRNDRRYYQRFI